jgi:hypothetical protein
MARHMSKGRLAADLPALAKLGLLVCLAGLAASACDTGYKFSISQRGPGSLSAVPATDGSGTTSTTAPVVSAPSCLAKDLTAKGGRRQDADDTGNAIGNVMISNFSGGACELRGAPGLELVSRDGTPLHVQDDRGATPELSPVVVAPRGKSTAEMVFTWANWCGPDPGPLDMEIDLTSGGKLTAPLDGSLGSYVPTCGRPDAPSVIRVEYAYVPAGTADLASA